MRLINKDLEDFYVNRKYVANTLSRYKKLTTMFVVYLSDRINKSSEEIDLNKIISIKDTRDVIIAIRPINSKIIDEYFQDLLNKKYSYCTIIQTRNVLVSFFSFLKRNYNFSTPMSDLSFDFKCLKPHPRPTYCLTRHEVIKLFNAIVNHSDVDNLNRDLILFSLLFSTGRRITEVLNLKVEHFDFEFNTFKLINSKSKRQLIIPMMAGMGAAIKLYCNQNAFSNKSFVFQFSKEKPFFTYKQIKTLFYFYCAKAKIRNHELYNTRRTFATLLYDEKVDIGIIQQLLSHIRGDTTQGYIKQNYVRNNGLIIQSNQDLYSSFRKVDLEMNDIEKNTGFV
ncbi:site-specific integrase [Paenibacillus sp. FSL H7-0690]|uniref:tyrosine-type recombinase/integrase n=1 Tax=Paenibacillus sp. FSL H7-0690 TaxID=2921437 RepID=UPI0030EDB196